jgi:apolipoprotein N-acyltransferase
MKFKANPALFSLFSALLLSVSWHWHLTIFIFFGFVPLLLLEHQFSQSTTPKRKLKVFGYAYLCFLIWNVAVTWWVVNASAGGAVLAFLANALLMGIVFLIYSNVKSRINKPFAIWLIIPIWLAWEYLHSIWDLAWIWLSIGNAFAFNHNWVQWFEFTGSSGGSFWILFVNVLITEIILKYGTLKYNSKPVLKIAAAIILPILISYLIVFLREPLSNSAKKYKTVIVQPNIDPYNDKFELGFQVQFFKMLDLIKGKISDSTEYLVLPETFIVQNLDEATLKESDEIGWFRDSILKKYPRLKIVLGASTYKFYTNKSEETATARRHTNGLKYDMFNTALQIDTSGLQVYHKSKLVPAVERMPFPALLKPLESLAIDMGGTTGSLGIQDERVCFTGNNNTLGVAPVVCYESVFSDYVTEYIRKNATFIFIITNDGWWGDTPGYVQHLNYARLRAIENRRQIARSANTGISCFIDEFGNMSKETKYWEEAVIEKDIYANKDLTFFSKYGDIISYTSVIITLLTLLWSLFLRFKR